jgi:hypothetical protein
MDSNVGGFFGPFLKFSGFDALELQGKADNDIIVFIDGINHRVEIFEAQILKLIFQYIEQVIIRHVAFLTQNFKQGRVGWSRFHVFTAGMLLTPKLPVLSASELGVPAA